MVSSVAVLLASLLSDSGWANADSADHAVRQSSALQSRSKQSQHRRCNNAREDLCVSFDQSVTDVYVDRMGEEIGTLDRQSDLPQFLSVRVGEEQFHGLLALGNRGTGTAQYIFIGWRPGKRGSPDIALLYRQYESGGMQFSRYLDFEPIACDRGAGMRWRYRVEGDYQKCSAVAEFRFCNYTQLPYPFLCSKPGQTIDELQLGCATAGYRVFEMVAANEVLFAGCRKHLHD